VRSIRPTEPRPLPSSSESRAGTAWDEMRSYAPRSTPTPATSAGSEPKAIRQAEPRPLQHRHKQDPGPREAGVTTSRSKPTPATVAAFRLARCRLQRA
jgi:hypothetical protein